jgi:hypothetical protein
VDCEELSNRQSPASTSSGAETKASKNPTGEDRAAKKPPFKPFNTFKPFKSLKALRAPENDTNPEILAQEVVEDLGSRPRTIPRSARDLAADVLTEKKHYMRDRLWNCSESVYYESDIPG